MNTARWRSTPKVPRTVAAGSPFDSQHRALLDVPLDVGARAAQLGARLARAIELDVVAGHHVLQALAVAVAEVAHLVGIECPGAARRAEQAAPEAGALLVRPVHEPQPDGRRALLRLGPERLDGAVDAERAVEPAAGRHRIRVRADDHEAIALPGHQGPEVPGGVDRDLDRQLVQPRAQEVARLRPLVRPADAPRAVGPARQAGELAEVFENAVGVHVATGGGAPSDLRHEAPVTRAG